jgi:hypothetical protein
MAGNAAPIFSRVGDIQGGVNLTSAAADYTGQNINNAIVFTADSTNGGFVQRLRFKAIGTNAATVCRVYYNSGTGRLAASISAVSGTPTGTPSTTGGTLMAGNYFAKIIAVDQYGSLTAASTESAAVAVTGTTGSIVWNWTAVTGAVSYMVFVGPVTGGQVTWFTTATNSLTQTAAIGNRDSINSIATTTLIGEVALPATTAATTTSTVDIDYPLNIALPPGGRILVGLGALVAAGWNVTCYGGKY